MYDLLILVCNQNKSIEKYDNKINVKALNANGNQTKKYYQEIWPFINNTHGILYKLFTSEGLGCFECCDEIFEYKESNEKNSLLPQIFPTSTYEDFEDCVSIKLSNDYDLPFVTLLDNLISQSPTSNIMFLCRGQSSDTEIILGTISLTNFINMLHTGCVQTNICYIISETQRDETQRDGSSVSDESNN